MGNPLFIGYRSFFRRQVGQVPYRIIRNKDNCLSMLWLRICVGIALAIIMTSVECFWIDTFVISDSASVEDVTLRDGIHCEVGIEMRRAQL